MGFYADAIECKLFRRNLYQLDRLLLMYRTYNQLGNLKIWSFLQNFTNFSGFSNQETNAKQTSCCSCLDHIHKQRWMDFHDLQKTNLCESIRFLYRNLRIEPTSKVFVLKSNKMRGFLFENLLKRKRKTLETFFTRSCLVSHPFFSRLLFPQTLFTFHSVSLERDLFEKHLRNISQIMHETRKMERLRWQIEFFSFDFLARVFLCDSRMNLEAFCLQSVPNIEWYYKQT